MTKLNADLWTMALHVAKAQALAEAKAQGIRIATLDQVERSQMAKATLIREAEEFLRRNE
jgi:hypothetical protein